MTCDFDSIIYREVFLDEHEYPTRIWDGDTESYANSNPALLARLEAAQEELSYERGQA
jgi:hypothetical protein